MKAFSERNPVTLALVALAVLAAILVLTFDYQHLPLVGAGPTYVADFTDASGLQAGDAVRIAGVKVGTVRSIHLTGDLVAVGFTVKNAWIGDESSAAIQIGSLLGQEYVGIDPQGSAPLDPANRIPTARTTTPIDVAQAFNGLGRVTGAINAPQLAKSFRALSTAFAGTHGVIRSSLHGLIALSQTISSRDAQLRRLAANTAALSGTLAGSNKQFGALISDGSTLLAELQARSRAITELLAGTRAFSHQISGLVTDNQRTLGPALTQLDRVSTILSRNQGNISRALHLIGPYYSLLDDAAGSGPWLDIYICGLFTAGGMPQLHPDAQRNCAAAGATG